MEPGLVSIITPVFNRVELLKETVESVIRQSHKNWELIVVDDNSTDCTAEVIRSFQQRDSRIHFHIKPENVVRGPASSRNIGFSRAHGEYIIYLDSDDLLFPDCLENRVNSFKDSQDQDFLVFPQVVLEESKGRTVLVNVQTGEDNLSRFLKLSPASLDVPWLNTAAIWKSSAIRSYGLRWQENLIWDDVVYHVCALLIGMKFKTIESMPDCVYRMHDKSREGAKIHQVSDPLRFQDLFGFLANQLNDKGLLTSERRNTLLNSFFHVVVLRLIDQEHYKLAEHQISWARNMFSLSRREFLTLKSYSAFRKLTRRNKHLTYYTNWVFRRICSETYFKRLGSSYMQVFHGALSPQEASEFVTAENAVQT